MPVRCGVIRHSDGCLQRTARLGGPGLKLATPPELVATWARINDTLRDLGPGWLFFVQTSRSAIRRAPVVPLLASGAQLLLTDDCIPDGGQSHYENIYYLSFPLRCGGNRWRSAGAESESQQGIGTNGSLDEFINRTDAALRVIGNLACETHWLCEEEAISHSRACTASSRQESRHWFEIAVALLFFASCGTGGLVL
jgi:type IV secretion system protein TrbE